MIGQMIGKQNLAMVVKKFNSVPTLSLKFNLVTSMPERIGSSKIVVDHDGLIITELSGNVATGDDTISIAHVVVSKPTSEPWLTLAYDEWICLTKGLMVLHYEDDAGTEVTLDVQPGETILIRKGERFRPCFPHGDTEYFPVCLPAFRPSRCQREEHPDTSVITKTLRALHHQDIIPSSKSIARLNPNQTSSTGRLLNQTTVDAHHQRPTPREDRVLYHMCPRDRWQAAVDQGQAYFPPTFDVDGGFTHATVVPHRLVETANHFYTAIKGDWIVLSISQAALLKLGIRTKDEQALPVGASAASEDWIENKWICPHIYGGIPTQASLGVVLDMYGMTRRPDGTFVDIPGLVKESI